MADNDQLLGENLDGKINPDSDGKGSNQEPDYLDVLVGDGKKYADDKNLAKGYANLQSHTNVILEEKLEMQKEIDTLKTTNRTVNDILAAIQGNPDLGAGGGDNLNQHGDGNEGISKEDIAALITGALNQRDEDKGAAAEVVKIQANQKITWDELSKVYGDKDKAKAAVSMYIGDDNKKKELVQNLGSYDPATLVEMLKVAIPVKGEQIDFGNADVSKANQHKELPTVQGLFTYAQAEKIRKDNPKLYNSRGFQARLHKSGAEHPNFWEGTSRKK
jgi:hypothetical protein